MTNILQEYKELVVLGNVVAMNVLEYNSYIYETSNTFEFSMNHIYRHKSKNLKCQYR